jgi:hypothetical protein
VGLLTCEKFFKVKEHEMTNKKILVGMLVIVLAFGMVLVSCNNGSTNDDDNSIEGTWVSPGVVYNNDYVKLVFANGEYVQSTKKANVPQWSEAMRGTYPKGAKSPVTCILTEVNSDWLSNSGTSGTVWIKWADLTFPR